MKLHHILLIATIFLLPFSVYAKSLNWKEGGEVTYSIQKEYASVVGKALQLFSADMQCVAGCGVRQVASGSIVIYQLDMASNKEMKALGAMRVPIMDFITKRDAFWIGVRKGMVVVVGSNGRGTAYGLMQLSQMPSSIDDKFERTWVPSVEFRGISMENVRLHGDDYRKLFEKMLRMRANAFTSGWDAGDTNFHITKELRALADSFGVDLATLHGGNSFRIHGHKKETMTVDVTWRDDGFGYVMATDYSGRKDGGCVYHLSYAGRPHDYLWLTTTQPGLVCNEMRTAYLRGAKRMWLAALHDINVAAYQLELFMDLAWNIDSVNAGETRAHLKSWLGKEFGSDVADCLVDALRQYYRLVAIRRPEFMDFSMQALSSKGNANGNGGVRNTEFNAEEFGNELERYINEYRNVCEKVKAGSDMVPDSMRDFYFMTVEYPVRCSALMSEKMLQAQESRLIGRKPSFHHDEEALESAARSMKAHWEIKSLTERYNEIVARQTWNKPMGACHRGLEVFGEPRLTDTVSVAEVEKHYNAKAVYAPLSDDGCTVLNACEYAGANGVVRKLDMVGHSMNAMELGEGGELSYRFTTGVVGGVLRLAFVPTFSPDGKSSQCSVSIDGGTPTTIIVNDGSAASERWAHGVLRGQTVVSLPVSLSSGTHTLTVKSLNEHVLFDQWMVDRNADRQFYAFPKKQ